MQTHLLERGLTGVLGEIILRHLEVAKDNCKKLKNFNNEDALHDFRVSIRRMQVWLKLCQKNKILRMKKSRAKRIRRLISITNESRDLQVFKSTLQDESFQLGKLQKKWQNELSKTLKIASNEVVNKFSKIDPHVSKIIFNLTHKNNPKSGRVTLRLWIEPILYRMAMRLDRDLKKVKSINDKKEAHKSRLLAKALRYLLEPLHHELINCRDLLVNLEELQDMMGDVRDRFLVCKKLDQITNQIELGDSEQNRIEFAKMKIQKKNKALYKELYQKVLKAPGPQFAERVRKAFDLVEQESD